MFERYTEKARRAIFFARHEAGEFGSPSIESEHLLLGILREDRTLTNRVLGSQMAVEAIRGQIGGQATIREKIPTWVDMPLSNECEQVLTNAAEEAELLSHPDIETEHVLLALLREENSFVAQIMRDCGLEPQAVREEALKIIEEDRAGLNQVWANDL
jgi:ATP-dependent Clp protease ATP-binding subunit ClpC